MDPNIAIRFIIVSCPEHQFCNMFNKEPLFSKTCHLVLDQGYNTAADIKWYLQDELKKFTHTTEILCQTLRILGH